MVYLDTSVLAAYYCPEPMSDQVESVILAADRTAISSLNEVEFVSALARKVQEKELTNEVANRILNEFQSHVDHSLYHRFTIEHHHYQKAFHWIAGFNTPLRTLDALHLALAATESAELMTADKQLAKAAKFFGVSAVLIG
ncbi:MAG: type II toxin-antitoxin system VapC family toxin [Proteobacteria bacterium]|nr:type II toxin-antitoxin system VapC family toxin [Pseudomonadota bacterium]MBU1689029.1 type II toxin-antitoxin system VapC family toxin [Pseudomonadota bacterium]